MNNFIKNNRLFAVISHVSVWAVLFSLPYLLSSGQSFDLQRIIEHSWIPLAFYAVIFYLNYFFFIDSFLFKKRLIVYFIVNILIIAFFIWMNFLLRDYFGEKFAPNNQKTDFPPRRFFVYIDTLSLIIPLIFSITLRIYERWVKTEDEKKESKNSQLESELQHLKYQLQPHFFFNSLNNIYSLVDISPEKAKETIHSLSILMRYLLYESNAEKGSLKKEIEFIKRYIELMDLRTSEKTIVKTDFPVLTEDLLVAPLLFISLIENAFKHGVSAVDYSNIYFSMQIEGQKIRFETKNNNFKKNDSDKSGSGIGLKNIQKRLALLYPEKHQFKIQNSEELFIAELEINTQK
ncbi:sensor histidine kinase [Flavobacterium marginilacus]|uniref:sensor histidine kinase n=1 Tax=Flavobacterium marginilacus TaxID=3003256 RepID=UPI00248ECB1A|nr:histidine kinase [Flavobacterium marginilacus]